ncbi:MAG: hypothetical protein KGQ93_13160 [Cyanobacteria bacterium REEB459]|nr:hypothetical protein [Cyanobacteria bacterium REEB459]
MEILVTLAALVIFVLVVGWLFKLVKTTLQTVLLVGFVLVALYFIFGIGPADLWQQLYRHIPGLGGK